MKRTLLCALALAAASTPASAQPRASERGGVWQTLDGTTIRVEYGRPAARGRTLFGGLVHWNEIWTPGANWATTLQVDHDVRINDVEVPEGEYSMWLVPRREGTWTLGLDDRVRRFHTQRPDSNAFVIRIPVEPTAGEHVERLTFAFEEMRRNAATLRMHWGETVVPLDIHVRATMERPQWTPEQLAPYLGEYAMTLYGEAQPDRFTFSLRNVDGHLRGGDQGTDWVELIPSDEPHVFHIAMLRDGELFDVEPVLATFTLEDGRATGFIVPGTGIPIWMEAERSR